MFNEKMENLALNISSKYNIHVTGSQLKMAIVLLVLAIIFMIVVISGGSTVKEEKNVPVEVQNMTVPDELEK